MSSLEEQGYLSHPHTSAGRIPTDAGYRHYVDALPAPTKLKDAQRRQIAAHFDISWPAISQNLNVLHDAGLITRRHDGHFRLYQANHAALGPIEPFLRAMWAADLDELRMLAEQDAREETQ